MQTEELTPRKSTTERQCSEGHAKKPCTNGRGWYCPTCKARKQTTTRTLQMRARRAEQTRARRVRDKQIVVEAYGGVCACCQESHIEFLEMDHINGGGREHRRTANPGSNFWRWVRDAGFPDYLQLLCANCNKAKHFCGVCPHQAGV